MFAVYPCRHAGQPGGNLGFQGSQVAGVHDRRAKLSEQPEKLRVDPRSMCPGALFRAMNVDIGALDALAKFGDLGE